MLKSFADPKTEAIFHGVHTHDIHKHMSGDLLKAAERRLDILNAADSLESLKLIPSMEGEAGVRDAHGKYSIPIDENWRIAFRWTSSPEDVEIKNW
ncbi:MAG: type II toxin-antitoxin system RelE/ParE family toxin [Candidatus Melainabacteria bacterium]|nr:type II toxin-antitoxin system RelE/ParE family toxin [Candidatus Melainabacteria bacterium]